MFDNLYDKYNVPFTGAPAKSQEDKKGESHQATALLSTTGNKRRA